MRVSCAAVAALLGGLFLFLGCDAAPGALPADGSRPPVLSAFSYTPATIILSQVPPGQVTGEQVRVAVTFTVTVDDADRDVDRIGYVVQSPVAGRKPLAEGQVPTPGPGRYEATTDVSLPRGEVGTYTVLVFAVDRAGNLSNQMRGSLRYFAQGGAPKIERVDAPASITRPGAGEPDRTIKIVAHVSDPDGLSNVSRVAFWNIKAPGAKIDLFDDGNRTESGDEAAGDGRYTRLIRITSQNSPGTNTFVFQATDRSGLESDTVHVTIRVD